MSERQTGREAAIAAFASRALGGASFAELVVEASEVVESELDARSVSIVEVLSGGARLILRAGLELTDGPGQGALPDPADGIVSAALAADA